MMTTRWNRVTLFLYTSGDVGDVFDNVCFVFLFQDIQVSENENMPAYLPQSRIGKKDKERAKRTLLQTTEPKVTGSNPVWCTFCRRKSF